MSQGSRLTGVPGDPRSHRRVRSAAELTLTAPDAPRWFALVALLAGVLATLLLAGCGQTLVRGKVGVEPTKSGNSTVLVRISGTEGVDYAGSYGLLGDKQERLTDTIGAGPTSYEVPVEEKGPVYEDVYANFMKLVPEGHLRIEIVSDGKVVLGESTRNYEGVVTLNYKPPGGRES